MFAAVAGWTRSLPSTSVKGGPSIWIHPVMSRLGTRPDADPPAITRRGLGPCAKTTSASNRTIFSAVVGEGEFALCDRNCHKSIEQGLMLTGARPVYMLPTRNRYGIIGPIPPSEMDPKTIRAKAQAGG